MNEPRVVHHFLSGFGQVELACVVEEFETLACMPLTGSDGQLETNVRCDLTNYAVEPFP